MSRIRWHRVAMIRAIYTHLATLKSYSVHIVDKLLIIFALQCRNGHAITTRAHAEALFAYNEVPTIAVAIDCWLRARHITGAPFFHVRLLLSQILACIR